MNLIDIARAARRYLSRDARSGPGDASIRIRDTPTSGTSARVSRGALDDWTGPLPATSWAARTDGRPDPGEVVWAWIPFEEDPSRGKDRPALVVARHPQHPHVVLALPLTSKDHDRDAEQERRAGRLWMDVGTGPWDRTGRPSEVRLNRVVQLRADAIRREGAALDRRLFDDVVAAARQASGHGRTS